MNLDMFKMKFSPLSVLDRWNFSRQDNSPEWNVACPGCAMGGKMKENYVNVAQMDKKIATNY